MKGYRVVIDPNVLVSILIAPNSTVCSLVDRTMEQNNHVLICKTLLTELHEVCTRPKFRRWFEMSQADELIELLRTRGLHIPSRLPSALPTVCADPKDNYLFALAEDGNADILVSGDKQVLAVTGTPFTILTPAQAIRQLH